MISLALILYFYVCQLAYFCLSVSLTLFTESEIMELFDSDIPCMPRQVSGIEDEHIYRESFVAFLI